MTLFRPVASRGRIAPRDFALPKDQEAWLERKLGSETTAHAVDQMLRTDRDLSTDERRILQALLDSARGTLRVGEATAITRDGSGPVAGAAKAWTLRGARVPAVPRAHAASEGPSADFDAAMAPYLVGQEGAKAGFRKMLLEGDRSIVRRIPPFMVIAGPEGHGKEQAIEGYAKAALGPNATVVTVDLARATDDDVERTFDDGNPGADLSLARLHDVEDYRSAVIHLRGLDDLATRAPELAERLLQLLSAKRNEAGHVWVNIIADFDTVPEPAAAGAGEGEDPVARLKPALGAAARYLPCAAASFMHLDDKAMLAYADAELQELYGEPGMGGLRIELENDARAVLGQILATPHQPLQELEPRLQQLILADVNRRADEIPADAILRVALADDLKNDPAALAQRVESLRSPDADILHVNDIFVVREEGRIADDAGRGTVLEQGAELVTTTLQLVNELTANEEKYAPEYGWLDTLCSQDEPLSACLASLHEALAAPGDAGRAQRRALGVRLLELVVVVEEALRGVASAGQARLAALGLAVDVDAARAIKSALDGARLVAKALVADDGIVDDARTDAAARLAANGAALADALTAGVDRVATDNEAALEGSLLGGFQDLGHDVRGLLDLAEARAHDDVWPLVSAREADVVLAAVADLRAALETAGDAPGPSATLLGALEAAGRGDVLDSILERAERVATLIGGLSAEDRPSIAEVRKRELRDTPAQRRKLAKELVRCENGATDEDAAIVQAELVKMPLRMLKRIKSMDIPVVAIRGKLTDYLKLPDDQVSTRPPGYPEGTTFADVPAIFTTYQRGEQAVSEVIIVTGERAGRRILPGHDPARGQSSVIHECGHAFDKGGVYSQSPEFAAVCDADASDLTPYEKQPVEDESGVDFDRGKAEAFAISVERLYGGDAQVRAKRPSIVGYVEEKTKDIDEEEGE